MDEATRRTWSGVFLTLGSTMAVGAMLRWARWQDSGASGSHPQVLWVLAFSAAGFLLVSAQLWLPIWVRRRADRQTEQARAEASDAYWAGE